NPVPVPGAEEVARLVSRLEAAGGAWCTVEDVCDVWLLAATVHAPDEARLSDILTALLCLPVPFSVPSCRHAAKHMRRLVVSAARAGVWDPDVHDAALLGNYEAGDAARALWVLDVVKSDKPLPAAAA